MSTRLLALVISTTTEYLYLQTLENISMICEGGIALVGCVLSQS